jgi:outer membrane biosynthesis protein TonB
LEAGQVQVADAAIDYQAAGVGANRVLAALAVLRQSSPASVLADIDFAIGHYEALLAAMTPPDLARLAQLAAGEPAVTVALASVAAAAQADCAGPSPTASPTVPASPSPVASPTAPASPNASPTAGPTDPASPGPTPAPSPSAEPTASTTPQPTPTTTEPPSPSASPTPSASAAPTAAPSPSTGSASPSPSAAPTPSAAGQPGPRLDSVTVNGSVYTVTGRGFRPGETVSGTVYSDPFSIGSATADVQGDVTLTWTMPATAAAGQHRVVLTGQQSGAVAEKTFFHSATLAGTGPAAATGLVAIGALVGLGLAALALLAARRRRPI